MLPVLLPALLAALSLPPDPARFEGAVAAGAGYDGNLALAPDGSTTEPVIGTTTLSLGADGGWSFPMGLETRLYVGARYDGVLCLDASDLTRHLPGAELSLAHLFNPWLSAFVSLSGGYGFYGDSARSGPRLGGRVTLRFRPVDPLTLRVGYGLSQNWASESVFSRGTQRIPVSAEVQVARRSWLSAGYTFTTGDQVFYESVTTALPGRGNPHRGTGSFSTLVPYQASATEHTLTLRAEQGIGSAVYVTVSYDRTWGSGDQGPYVVNSFFGAAGYRF